MKVNGAMLTCTLELTPIGPGGTGLAFLVTNPSQAPVEVHYFIPFIEFELSVETGGVQIPLIQPAYDTGVQPVRRVIAQGETIRIETPIKLVFDPDAPPYGGVIPTHWVLKHAPVPVDLTVTLQLGGAVAAPCQAHWDPQADTHP